MSASTDRPTRAGRWPFTARLKPLAGSRATVVCVAERWRPPSLPLVPASIRSDVLGQVASLNASRMRAAQRLVDDGARQLRKVGWRARGEVRVGVPTRELLRAVKAARADLLVVGARGTGGLARFLLGSVADAGLKRPPVSELIVK